MTEKVYWGVALLMALGIIYVGAAFYRPLLTAFHVLVSVLLVLVVLLQSGRAADLAGAFGGAGSQTAFGPRGAATFLSKATTFLAVVFMATSLALAMVSGSASS
ncbi:MAG: preprotein translocase subunit SecG [Acidobacteriota bacterium]